MTPNDHAGPQALSEAVPVPTDISADAAYAAMSARDARFDGRFFVGVTSTGIYCRPVCRVRLPRRENCRFFAQPAQAEAAGFRPCLRCRPELAPGLSLNDSSQVLAEQAARLIGQALREGGELTLTGLADRLGVTDRHLRRIFQQAHGVTPMAWITTQRLLLAKQLLTDTALPITQVALASGFASLRRFHDAFATHYRLQPSQLRRRHADDADADVNTRPSGSAAARVTAAAAPAPARTVRAPRAAQTIAPCNRPEDPQGAPLWLAYRPPYDLAGVGRFIGRRALPGLEQLTMPPANGAAPAPVWCLRRTLSLVHGGQRLAGWLAIEPRPERDRMRLVLSPELLPAAGAVLQRARQALDLDAEPHRIGQALAGLPGPPRPGLRAPGAWCGFESAVRVILGQQITVAAANTIALRLVALLGEPIGTPWPGLNRLFPTPEALATADAEAIGRLGIVRQRVRALQALARAVVDGSVVLDRSAPLAATQQALLALPGIGPWTVQLIAMRALAWPDAWLPTDIGVLNALGTRDPAEASAAVQACRPWRAYAVMHLWLSLANEVVPGQAAAAESDTTHAGPGVDTRPQSRQRRLAGQAQPSTASTPTDPAARPGVRHVRTP